MAFHAPTGGATCIGAELQRQLIAHGGEVITVDSKETDMVPVGAKAQPQQIANVMRFLLGPEADFVCGSVIFVHGDSDTTMRNEDF